MVDYIADYLENIRDRRVFPDVKPGYMKALVPDSAPEDGEKWETIFKDVEGVIMPGVSKKRFQQIAYYLHDYNHSRFGFQVEHLNQSASFHISQQNYQGSRQKLGTILDQKVPFTSSNSVINKSSFHKDSVDFE